MWQNTFRKRFTWHLMKPKVIYRFRKDPKLDRKLIKVFTPYMIPVRFNIILPSNPNPSCILTKVLCIRISRMRAKYPQILPTSN